MIAPRYLTFSTASSLWPFILVHIWKPFGLFVITFVLSGPISILYLVVVYTGDLFKMCMLLDLVWEIPRNTREYILQIRSLSSSSSAPSILIRKVNEWAVMRSLHNQVAQDTKRERNKDNQKASSIIRLRH